MIGAFLACVVLVGQVPAPDPMALVAQLGSARFAEREAAAAALEQLGRSALSALRAVKDVRDPEIRSRASTLITKIEGALLTRPTMIALNFRDQTLGKAIQSFSEQADIAMAIYPVQPVLEQKRVTLQEAGALPFWKALDRLCDVGQLQYNFGVHHVPNSREPVFTLYPGIGRPPGPVSDFGPFRVNLVGLHYQRDVSFFNHGQVVPSNRLGLPPHPLPGPIDTQGPRFNMSEEFHAKLQLAAEPRLSVSQYGAVKLIEAIDDRGQSLLFDSNSRQTIQRQSAYFGLSAGPTLHLQVPLKRAEQPSRELKRLRGTVPVVVSTRKGNPLVVPLNGSNGKTFQNEEATVEIREVRVNPNTHQTSINLMVRTNSTAGGDAELLTAMPTIMARRNDPQQQQLEVVDGQGKSIPWYLSADAEGARMTLTLTPHDQGAPVEIRYHSMVRTTTDVSFEFTDVPLP